MSATRTTERKLEELQVGDVMVLQTEEDEATATYFTLVTHTYRQPENDGMMVKIGFLAETDHDGVIESSFEGLDNQRVSVLA